MLHYKQQKKNVGGRKEEVGEGKHDGGTEILKGQPSIKINHERYGKKDGSKENY